MSDVQSLASGDLPETQSDAVTHTGRETQRLRLDIGYDGTDFHGWAVQPDLRTVQGEIERALRIVVRDPNPFPRLTVGGRTDTGVHARGQVAHVDVPADIAKELTPRRITALLNRTAPDAIVHDVTLVPESFDARFSALRRRYEYRVTDRRMRRDPLTARFTAVTQKDLDPALLQAAADEFLGLNDFTSFCKARPGSTAVRELLLFEWTVNAEGVCVARIEADAFCHSMVRALVGIVCEVGQGVLSLDGVRRLRDARERTNKIPVMPAHGLSLEEIAYPPLADLGDRAELTRARRIGPNGEVFDISQLAARR